MKRRISSETISLCPSRATISTLATVTSSSHQESLTNTGTSSYAHPPLAKHARGLYSLHGHSACTALGNTRCRHHRGALHSIWSSRLLLPLEERPPGFGKRALLLVMILGMDCAHGDVFLTMLTPVGLTVEDPCACARLLPLEERPRGFGRRALLLVMILGMDCVRGDVFLTMLAPVGLTVEDPDVCALRLLLPLPLLHGQPPQCGAQYDAAIVPSSLSLGFGDSSCIIGERLVLQVCCRLLVTGDRVSTSPRVI